MPPPRMQKSPFGALDAGVLHQPTGTFGNIYLYPMTHWEPPPLLISTHGRQSFTTVLHSNHLNFFCFETGLAKFTQAGLELALQPRFFFSNL